MKQPKYSVGIDISSESFTVCASSKPGVSLQKPEDQDLIEFLSYLAKSAGWHHRHRIKPLDRSCSCTNECW